MLRLLSLATRGGLQSGAEGCRLGLTAAATRLTFLQDHYCTTSASGGESSDAAEPPEQMGNPGPRQPQPVHISGEAYRPNILRYMKHMGFRKMATIPPTFLVPEGTPSNEKVAAAIRQVEQAHHELFGNLPGPPPKPDLVEKYLAPENASLTEKREAELQRIMREYQRFEGDTGSSEVQVALLTTRISQLAEHLKVHKKDHSSRHGLEAALNKRRKLLAYLRRTNFGAYANLISSLGLRDNYQKMDRLTLQIQQRRLRGPSKKKNKKKSRR